MARQQGCGCLGVIIYPLLIVGCFALIKAFWEMEWTSFKTTLVFAIVFVVNKAIYDIRRRPQSPRRVGVPYHVEQHKRKADEMNFTRSFFNSIIEKIKGNGTTPSERGVEYFRSGEYYKAINEFGKAINLNPKDANAYNNRGTANLNLGNYQQSINDFTNAITINPKFADAYHGRGVANEKNGNKQQAINDFTKTVEINPKHRNAFFHRGQVYYTLGNYHLAIKDNDKVIELDPTVADAYFGRGVVNATMGNDKEAIKDLNNALEIDPRHTSADDLRKSILSKEAALIEEAIEDRLIARRLIATGEKRKRQGISRAVKTIVWRRDGGCCVECGSNWVSR